MDEYSNLLKKLTNLGVKKGAGSIISHPTKKTHGIETFIEGFFEHTFHGDTFQTRTAYPLHSYHGDKAIAFPDDLTTLSRWAKLSDPVPKNLENVLFLDTETSGLSGGTGTYIFMVGLGWFENNDFIISQVFLKDPSEELAFLETLVRLTNRFQTVVTYNGKSFDIPIMRSRLIQNQFSPDLVSWQHVDILQLVRQIWRYSFDSRSLKDMEVQVLKFIRTEEEVPGWMVPQLYFDYLVSGNSQPLTGVFYHNRLDILSLMVMFLVSNDYLNHCLSPQFSHNLNNETYALARLFERLEAYETANSLYQLGIENRHQKSVEATSLLRAAKLAKRSGHTEDALMYLEKAGEDGSLEAWIQLAIIYEHEKKDYQSALRFLEFATGTIPDNNLISSQIAKDKLEKRRNRVLTKLQKADQKEMDKP